MVNLVSSPPLLPGSPSLLPGSPLIKGQFLRQPAPSIKSYLISTNSGMGKRGLLQITKDAPLAPKIRESPRASIEILYQESGMKTKYVFPIISQYYIKIWISKFKEPRKCQHSGLTPRHVTEISEHWEQRENTKSSVRVKQ